MILPAIVYTRTRQIRLPATIVLTRLIFVPARTYAARTVLRCVPRARIVTPAFVTRCCVGAVALLGLYCRYRCAPLPLPFPPLFHVFGILPVGDVGDTAVRVYSRWYMLLPLPAIVFINYVAHVALLMLHGATPRSVPAAYDVRDYRCRCSLRHLPLPFACLPLR